MMAVNIKVSAVAVLLMILVQVAHSTESISYEDFLQSMGDALKSHSTDSSDPQLSELPEEVLKFMKEELYEKKVLKEFPTITKEDLTKSLIKDIKTRDTYYKKNKKLFKSFITITMEADMKNYPDEDSGIDVMTVQYLSFMTMEAVDAIIEETIVSKNAPAVDSWKVLTMLDAFRTIYFYCKYPKEMAPFLTEKTRVNVKEWLDDTATWGTWGFENAPIQPDNLNTEWKMEL